MVVVPEPAVKGGGAFLACAVDGGVGPAVDQRADEAFCFPVCLWPVGPGAEMADAEGLAGERVDGGEVGGAVVGEQPFDLDAVAVVKHDSALQKRDRGCGLLVAEDFGVGETAVVVDADVDVFPADAVAPLATTVGVGRVVVLMQTVAPALAGAALDPAELLDVDVDELARPRAFVANRLLESKPAQPPHPRAGQDPRDCRERHRQGLCDLCRGEAHPAQLPDRFDPIRRRAIPDVLRRRRTIEKSLRTLASITIRPLASTADADTGGLGRRRQRPSLNNHPLGQTAPTTPTESRVTVKLHPVSSLGPSCL